MKSNFYWIKVGLLIGLGFVLAKLIVPLGLIALMVIVPILGIVLFLGFTARSLGAVVGYFKLRQGWTEREQRSVRRS